VGNASSFRCKDQAWLAGWFFRGNPPFPSDLLTGHEPVGPDRRAGRFDVRRAQRSRPTGRSVDDFWFESIVGVVIGIGIVPTLSWFRGCFLGGLLAHAPTIPFDPDSDTDPDPGSWGERGWRNH
jgi:hypothetical protein